MSIAEAGHKTRIFNLDIQSTSKVTATPKLFSFREWIGKKRDDKVDNGRVPDTATSTAHTALRQGNYDEPVTDVA